MTGRRRLTLIAVAVRAAAAFGLLAGMIGAAHAHAALIRADPADGAVLAQAPARLTLTFNEPVAPLALRLVGPDGAAQALQAQADGAKVTIGLPAPLAAGAHLLSWRVASEDGHPIGGTTSFAIGAGAASPQASPTAKTGDAALAGAIWAARAALWLALLFGAGAAFARVWLADGQGADRMVFGLAALGLVAAPLSLGLQGLDALGLPLDALLRPEVWAAGGATTYVRTALLAGLALLAAAGSLVVRGGSAAGLATLGLLGVGAALAASGHAATAAPRWATLPAVAAHGVAAAVWAGALLVLATRFSRPALARFSRAAPATVAALVLAGTPLAVIQLGSMAALWGSDYGRLLLAKLGLVGVLLALAGWNRFRLTEPALAGEPAAQRRLGRIALAEAALVAAILGVAAGWRFTPPPRTFAAVEAAPAQVTLAASGLEALVTVARPRVGGSPMTIALRKAGGAPLDPKAVTLVLSRADAGLEPIRRDAARTGDGAWEVAEAPLAVAGRWRLRLDLLIDDFTLTRLDGELVVAP
ncbi:copper resistance protein C [Methylopila jiangsuensis]|uniref:Copper resistance protein C n=1 Tax=Methylopila jiangsuensis TaxID=586230 RepID=A0A9W6JHT3_9HYPH|nr:copper resistance protein CopC [Methylopila jiangsuensis]MDR6284729.1 copper transport protein [Methylopila jiangsuensis]GLK77881.1 copper resistance protein C [Methylopila jiangsuensis]